MTVKSIQKVIKVGDSLAVTIPAKDAKAAGIKAGDSVQSTLELLKPTKSVSEKLTNLDVEYRAFKRQYSQTLENLANR